jgi:hypothetical protein
LWATFFMPRHHEMPAKNEEVQYIKLIERSFNESVSCPSGQVKRNVAQTYQHALPPLPGTARQGCPEKCLELASAALIGTDC